jgi:Flp pilus assembly pilin Flp
MDGLPDARLDDGASLVEYALLVALIAVVAIASLWFFGDSRDNLMSRNASSLETGVVLPVRLLLRF